MIKAVILDWNGVVNDDWEATFLTSNEILEEMGHKKISREEFRKVYEMPWRRFYENQGIPVPESEEERARWARLFPKHFDKIKAIPAAIDAIKSLKEKKIKVIIFSALNQGFLDREIEEYGLKSFVDFAYGNIDDKRQKVNALVKAHEIEKEKTLFVGDMVHDVETAKQAGIRSVAVLCGYGSKERLEKAKPDFLLKDLGELPALIEKLEGEK